MVDVLQLFMVAVVVFLMLGLGATVTWETFTGIVKAPKGPLIGMFCQFGCMPLLSFSLAKILGVSNLTGLSMVMVGCTPGGVTSNLFTYFSRGDVTLSIAMTVMSNSLAFGMMPLLLYIYGTSFTTDTVKIPYANLIVGLFLTLFPAAIGMLVLKKNPPVAKKLEKIASILGMIFILVAGVQGVRDNLDLLTSGWKLWFAAVLMCPMGTAIGYCLAKLGKMEPRQCRTVALETGIQNTTLTIAIIMLSFPKGDVAVDGEEGGKLKDDIHSETVAFALMYTLFLIVTSAMVSFVFNRISAAEVEDDKEGKKVEIEVA